MRNKSVRCRLTELPSLDLRCPVGVSSARESVNYRPMPDGSIKKRDGYSKKLTLPSPPSCIASVCRDGQKRLCAVSGTCVYSLDLDAGSAIAFEGSLPSAPSTSSLFTFGDRLLILDGSALRELGDNAISAPVGYAPLYGKNWHPDEGGEVFEPRNLLTKNARIHFRGETSKGTLYLPEGVSSITRVEVNGEEVASGNYSFNHTVPSIASSFFGYSGNDIVIWLTFAEGSAERSLLDSCLSAEVVGSGSQAVIFCSRSPSSPHTVFRSTPVSLESLEESGRGFAGSDNLYFPETGSFSVGSDALPVTALLALDDRVIVFNSDEAWLVPSLTARPDPLMLCRGVGCSSVGAAVICGEFPAGLSGHGIWLWEPDAEAYSELIASCISGPVDGLIDDGFAARGRLISDRERRELWVFDPQSLTSPILIYNRDSRRWYSYTDASPELAFYHDGHIGFTDGASVFLFDPQTHADLKDGSSVSPIASSFVSAMLDFDTADEKLARRLSLKLEGNATVCIEYDSGRSESLTFAAPVGEVTVIRKRLRKERFRQLGISVSDSSSSDGRIYEIEVEADILQK